MGSRRQCEELIASGRVEVDRRVVTELGTRVDPASAGNPPRRRDAHRRPAVYYAVNKPTGVVSTNRDPAGRPRVIDLVPPRGARLFPVGRLDLNSEGLILVTNDGELANRLTHPRYEVPKTYLVQVAGKPEPEMLAKICRGVHLAEGLARAEKAAIKSHHKNSTLLGDGAHARARTGKSAGCWPRWGTRCCGWCGRPSGRCGWENCPPGPSGRLSREELDALRRAVAPKGPPMP